MNAGRGRRIDPTTFDDAMRALRALADETGAERVDVTVRADGRVYITGGDGQGMSLWWGHADVEHPRSGMPAERLPSALVEMVKRADSALGAGKPRKK